MRYQEISERHENTSYSNAINKMIAGYEEGYNSFVSRGTCYAYVGAELAKLHPPNAVIRLWGRKSSGMIVHGDAVLPNGTVISTIPSTHYEQKGYELVSELSFEEFKNQLP